MATAGRVLPIGTKLQIVVPHAQLRHVSKDSSDYCKQGCSFSHPIQPIQDVEKRWRWNGLVIFSHSFRMQRIKAAFHSAWLLKSGERENVPPVTVEGLLQWIKLLDDQADGTPKGNTSTWRVSCFRVWKGCMQRQVSWSGKSSFPISKQQPCIF